jgi:hypothetical protein
MDNFMADINRRAVLLELEIDDVNRPVDAGAEAARVCEINLHGPPFHTEDLHLT